MECDIALVPPSNFALPFVLAKTNITPDNFDIAFTFKRLPWFIAFSKQTSDVVVRWWQQVLDEMKLDGTFKSIHEKWLSAGTYPTSQDEGF